MLNHPKPHTYPSLHHYPCLAGRQAFGMMMSDRQWSSESGYRFGFNGQELENEVYNSGQGYSAEFWQCDTRLGRRWNLDPVVSYSESNYATFRNCPTYYTDVNGDSEDGPGGRKAGKRAQKKIEKLERKGYKAWIADQVDNDGRLDIAFVGQDESGDFFIGGASVKLNLFNKIANMLSNGDAWVHSDDGEKVGQDIANVFPGVSIGHIANGIGEGVDLYGNDMEGMDYLTYGLNAIPTTGVAGESVSVVLQAAKSTNSLIKLAKKYSLNADSPTTKQLLENFDMDAAEWFGQYRKGKINRELGDVKGKTIGEVFDQADSKTRKLIIEQREKFKKLNFHEKPFDNKQRPLYKGSNSKGI